MRADEDARKAVDCPLCKARRGHPCINTSTRHPFVGFTHGERRKAAKEAGDPNRCAMCGIHLFNMNPIALARHAEHNRAFAEEVQRKINDLVQG